MYFQRRENSPEDIGSFKHRDFESETTTATEIVKKVNHILDVRQSEKRKEYIALRERKSHRKKNFQLGPRWLYIALMVTNYTYTVTTKLTSK